MKTYIIDLDGTMYSGSTNIDGAREFIDYLHSKNLPYIFLTNNATRTKKQAKEHMLNLGFKDIKEEEKNNENPSQNQVFIEPEAPRMSPEEEKEAYEALERVRARILKEDEEKAELLKVTTVQQK